jgi:hypothetical protein
MVAMNMQQLINAIDTDNRNPTDFVIARLKNGTPRVIMSIVDYTPIDSEDNIAALTYNEEFFLNENKEDDMAGGWLGITKGEPFNRELNDDGHIHKSCLICKGVKPTPQSYIDFIPQAIGHLSDCKHFVLAT